MENFEIAMENKFKNNKKDINNFLDKTIKLYKNKIKLEEVELNKNTKNYYYFSLNTIPGAITISFNSSANQIKLYTQMHYLNFQQFYLVRRL